MVYPYRKTYRLFCTPQPYPDGACLRDTLSESYWYYPILLPTLLVYIEHLRITSTHIALPLPGPSVTVLCGQPYQSALMCCSV
jgi:hypothetical protein